MNVCLAGASGTAGRSIMAWLGNDLNVLGLSRSRPADTLPGHVRWKQADLEERASLRSALAGEPIDTLIFAASGQPVVAKYDPISVPALRRLAQRVARKPRHDINDYVKTAWITQTWDPGHRNFALLNNLVEVILELDCPLQHIVLLTGGMSYGIQTGPVFDRHWSGVLTEDSPRHPAPSWYYDMEDYAGYLRRTCCPVTVLRPSYILYEGGFVRQNLAHSIGLYLESQRLLGGKAVFPGGEETYHCQWSFTPSSLIGRQVDWAIHHPEVWGEIFNSVTQPPVTWSTLWPQLAAAWELEVEVPSQPLSLGRQIRARVGDYPLLAGHGYDLDYFTPIDFIDIAMVCYWDMVYAMDKAVAHGFDAGADIFRPFAQEQQRLSDWMRQRGIAGSAGGAAEIRSVRKAIPHLFLQCHQ